MIFSLKLLTAFLAGANALAPHVWQPENGDDVSTSKVTCGAYGDPHIDKVDGTFANHMGKGMYQLINLPTLGTEVHYYGCGIETGFIDQWNEFGSSIGALAIKIGDKVIEIFSNDLRVVGGAEYYMTMGVKDKPMGPFELDAGITTITIVREAVAASKLGEATWMDNAVEEWGHLLYRWTVSTDSGFILHSHASKVESAKGGWALDVHINYPEGTEKASGVCVDECHHSAWEHDETNCGSAACMPVNSSGTYGIFPVFSAKMQADMKAKCPEPSMDAQCPSTVSGGEACTHTGKDIEKARVACKPLSTLGEESTYESCLYDFCMGVDVSAVIEWAEEHKAPERKRCKLVADPRVTSYETYKFDFLGQGVYSALKKEPHGEYDPCELEIQSFECPAACPGPMCGMSYVHAVGIKAPGGTSTHDIILESASCTIDGNPCGVANGKNVGVDGVKLTPYVPIAGFSENMGDYGPGERGWYIYAGGHAVNVTVTKANNDASAPPMMNVLVAAPKMCTKGVSGLCSTTSLTKDTFLADFAAKYDARHSPDKKKGDKTINLLAPQGPGDVPTKTDTTYPALTDDAMPGLKGLACPAL